LYIDAVGPVVPWGFDPSLPSPGCPLHIQLINATRGLEYLRLTGAGMYAETRVSLQFELLSPLPTMTTLHIDGYRVHPSHFVRAMPNLTRLTLDAVPNAYNGQHVSAISSGLPSLQRLTLPVHYDHVADGLFKLRKMRHLCRVSFLATDTHRTTAEDCYTRFRADAGHVWQVSRRVPHVPTPY
jgi:hypothetical protein